MIIVGDIGNSEVKICLFKKNKLVKKIYLKSHLINNNYLKKKLYFLNNIKLIEKIIFSSVVPKIYILIKKYFFKYLKCSIIEIKQLNLSKLISINVDKKQVGSDRICNAIYVSNNIDNFIIVDFGTATTFDVVVKKKYFGGIIAPGVSLSLNTLISSASLIPYLKLKKVNTILGKNTINAVRSGFYWGYQGLVQNIIDRISKQTKRKYKVILTGGYSYLFTKSIKQKTIIDKDVTIKGLLRISNLL